MAARISYCVETVRRRAAQGWIGGRVKCFRTLRAAQRFASKYGVGRKVRKTSRRKRRK